MTAGLDGRAASAGDASIAHLGARLELLESRVAQLVEHRRARRANRTADHQYRGVYLSDADIDILLAERRRVVPVDDNAGAFVAEAVRAAAADGDVTRLH